MMRLFPHKRHTARAFTWVIRSVGLLSLLPLFGLTQATMAFAEGNTSSVTMSYVVGFKGYYGKQHWVPVNLTLHNNTNRIVDGDLQLDVGMSLGSGRSAQGTMHWHETLHPSENKPVQIAVPGPVIDGEAALRFMVDGADVAHAKLTGTALGNAALVAVLSDEPQTAQFLTGSSNGLNGAPVLPETLNRDSLPVNPNLYNELSAVAATPVMLNSLRPDQVSALQTWVKLGGILIVMGTGDAAGHWANAMPLLAGPHQSVSGRSLATFVGDSVTPPSDISTSAKGVKPDAMIWAGTSSQPLIAALDYGRGTVVQTAFSPLDRNLVSWSSNAALWTSVLAQANPKGESTLQGLLDHSQVLSLASASTALSPLRIPSLQFWAVVFGVYAFVIGPVLFYILRKSKSEPLGWMMVPVLSLVTTVAIYSFGATQRPSGVLTEGVGVLDLVGDGTAETYGIRAFMSPSVTSGFTTPSQSMLLLPLSEDNVLEQGQADVRATGRTSVSFSDVGRWGVRYVYAAGAVQNQGEVDAALWSVVGGLMGSVKNTTPYVLHNVALCWDGSMYEIGDMKPGQTITVNGTTTSVTVSGGYLSQYGSYNHDITHGIGRSLGTAVQPLLDLSLDNKYKVMVIATTAWPIPSLPTIQTNQKIDSDQTLVMVREMAKVSVYSATGVQ